MAVDMFLKIEGIVGECQKDGHKDEIDILSFSFGATQTASWSHGGAGGGSGKADISDISIMKRVDKASPLLFSACSAGKHIKEVLIVAQKAGDGGKPLIYYKVKMEDVIISQHQNTGATHDDSVMESIVFSTAKLTFDYQAQDKTGAKLGGPITASYDIRSNKAT